MTTLTYDPSETPEGELTAEEQDSLAVGEKLVAEQQELYAGKFRDAEELEKAYIELQKKFGSRNTDSKEEVDQNEPEEESTEEEERKSILDALWEEGQKGKFSEDTLNQLNELSTQDLAKMYLEYRSNVESSEPESGFSEQDAKELRGIAGGDEGYSKLLQWAGQNMTEKYIDMYDAVMASGDKNAMAFAVEALYAKYQDAVGVEGELITGKAARSTKDVFRSQAEVVRAMKDPRYDSDPAYRSDVFAKLERSDIKY